MSRWAPLADAGHTGVKLRPSSPPGDASTARGLGAEDGEGSQGTAGPESSAAREALAISTFQGP